MAKKRKRKPKPRTFKAWRKVKKLTLDAFARTVGIKYSTVAKYDEYPDRRPQDAHRDKIAAHYSDCPLVTA